MNSTRTPAASSSDTSADAREDIGQDVWLSTDSCRHLLASVRVARVAFVDEGKPQLVVMNHYVDGVDVLLQTAEVTRLADLTRDGATIDVVLEADSVQASGRSGWSVVASGTMARDSSSAVARMPIPWRPNAVGVLLRITVDAIHGRQVESDPRLNRL
jgi:hypothetical protein